jgi:hypothetical protein
MPKAVINHITRAVATDEASKKQYFPRKVKLTRHRIGWALTEGHQVGIRATFGDVEG